MKKDELTQEHIDAAYARGKLQGRREMWADMLRTLADRMEQAGVDCYFNTRL